MSTLIRDSYQVIDYSQNLTKNRDWTSMLITLACYPAISAIRYYCFHSLNYRVKAQVLNSPTSGSLALHLAFLPNPVSRSPVACSFQADSAWLSNCDIL